MNAQESGVAQSSGTEGPVVCRSCELVRDFTEEAHCIALHPSGYNLLVGFTDKLRLFAVLVDTLK